MKRKSVLYGSLALLIAVCVGCAKDPLDPTQIGGFRPVPVRNVILDSLWVGDEPDPTWAGAEDPRPEDLVSYEQDYVFGEGDIVRISIYELLQESLAYINDYQVTETGKISIPEVGLVQAAGLTEKGLEDEIKDILSPSVLKDPSVSVILRNSDKLVYSIQGAGVGRPGQYAIPRFDFRLSRAVAVAGGVAQFNASNIYVTRRVSGESDLFEQISASQRSTAIDGIDIDAEDIIVPPSDDKDMTTPEDDMFEIISPSANANINNGIVIATAELATEQELEALAAPEGMGTSTGTKPSAVKSDAGTSGTGRIEWVFEDGKWIPVSVDGEDVSLSKPLREDVEITSEPAKERERASYGWDEIGSGGTQTRVIKIPRSKLFGGDPRYDIIIRPSDTITVPVDVIGEFFVMGNLNNQGAITLTGRPITLKQAISLAGGLGPLAWPKRVEVIRRVGQNHELTVMVDLDKIARGEQPDFFIKPYDLINVGSHGSARYLAALRNAFFASYGFDLRYSRNFADRDFGEYDSFNPVRFAEDLF